MNQSNDINDNDTELKLKLKLPPSCVCVCVCVRRNINLWKETSHNNPSHRTKDRIGLLLADYSYIELNQ